jgi:4-oxalocrotonate tautomerase
MPHVIVKLVAGRTEEEKARLAAAITEAVIAGAGTTEAAVSVAFEDIAKEDWVEAVYKPDILGKWDTVIKKPGYDPLQTG